MSEELKAKRIPILEAREEAAKKGDSAKVDECNKELRALNCQIQGIANPDEEAKPKRRGRKKVEPVVEGVVAEEPVEDKPKSTRNVLQ